MNIIRKQASTNRKQVTDALEYLRLDEFFGPQIIRDMKRIKYFLRREIEPQVPDIVNSASDITDLFEQLRSFKLPHKYLIGEPQVKLMAAMCAEIARVDLSLATGFLVQVGLIGYTLKTYGSKWLKDKYLLKICNYELVGGWGLTEFAYGSNSTQIETQVVFQNGK